MAGWASKRFDFAVANPPFSDKAWTNGLDPSNDEYRRFDYGEPPAKNGDLAFLLHLVASLNSTGKGAIIMPHGDTDDVGGCPADAGRRQPLRVHRGAPVRDARARDPAPTDFEAATGGLDAGSGGCAVDSVYLGESSFRSYYHHYRDSNGRLRLLTRRFLAYEMIVVNPSGGFWRANTAAYRIARTGEGGDTLVVIEAGVPALPVTDEDRSAYVDEIVEDSPGARRAAEEVAALMPDVKPILARMSVDDEGRLWVQRLTPADAPAFYDMYSEDGDYLGSVRFAFTPAYSEFFWVQRGNICTWVVDEMDVPYVVRAPLG